MQHNILSDALVTIRNADDSGKLTADIPVSRLIGEVLRLMREKGYLGGFEYLENGRGGLYRVNLSGRINGCGAILPRYAVRVRDLEQAEIRYLPAKDFGMLVITTPDGVLTNYQAKEANTGGKLLAYIY